MPNATFGSGKFALAKFALAKIDQWDEIAKNLYKYYPGLQVFSALSMEKGCKNHKETLCM